ncbi:MAG TPA: TIGR01244 family sulfur transferase [Caulobacteraceae bacterium]|nr:TIGR01244 family sulfur transferase [Caulobacteraceae bacterium]
MTDFRHVTDDFAVSPQITPADAAAAAAEGYALIINNRPDGEAPGQPSSAELEAAVRAAGMDYAHIPFVGRPGPDQVRAVHDAAAQAKGPVLAFCRSGTRSITVWTLGQAVLDRRDRGELARLASDAGYDLAAILS